MPLTRPVGHPLPARRGEGWGEGREIFYPINSRIFDCVFPPRINDSPTKMALAPHCFNRSTSARVWMPLSATSSVGQASCLSPFSFFKLETGATPVLRFNFAANRSVVNFDKRGKSGFRCQRMEFLQLGVGQNGDDEQDGVRAPFDGFEKLPSVNDKVLAQQRQLHRCANLPEMIK